MYNDFVSSARKAEVSCSPSDWVCDHSVYAAELTCYGEGGITQWFSCIGKNETYLSNTVNDESKQQNSPHMTALKCN